MLKVVHDAEASNENAAGASLLDEIVRDGARAMLAAALQAEVSPGWSLNDSGSHDARRRPGFSANWSYLLGQNRTCCQAKGALA